MRRYYVRAGIYVCVIDPIVFFLDLSTEKYLSVDCRKSPALLQAFMSAASTGTPSPSLQFSADSEPPQELTDLVSRGLLTQDDASSRASRACVPTPSRSFVSVPPAVAGSFPMLALARLSFSCISVYVRLHFIGLKGLVSKYQRWHRSERRVSDVDLERERRVIREVCRVRPWLYTAHERCLFDALVLTDFLHRCHLPAHLVIAVHPMPFSAHAWVQLREYVVDDPIELIRMYTPILTA